MGKSRVVVTGGAGKVGTYVLNELIQHGHDVSSFDVATPKTYGDLPDVKYDTGDILKLESCKAAIKGADVVVHLAAIPRPAGYPPDLLFNINVTGTFNVLQAACDLGIGRVVCASSDAAYGFNFRNSFSDIYYPDYLPLDEEHPLRPKDAYGLSKKLGEDIGQSFNAKYGTTIIMLRISHVVVPVKTDRAGIDAYQKNIAASGFMLPSYAYNEAGNIFHRIFSYNDVRDAAIGFRLAIEEGSLEGKYQAIGIGALDDNSTRFTTEELIHKYQYSEVPQKRKLRGREPLIDFGKAKRILGFRSKFNWWKAYGSRVV